MTSKPGSPNRHAEPTRPAGSARNAVTAHAEPERAFAMRFTSTPRGARLARRLAAHRLDAWGIPYGTDRHDVIVLVVAELVANSVRHGHVPGRDVRLRLERDVPSRQDGLGGVHVVHAARVTAPCGWDVLRRPDTSSTCDSALPPMGENGGAGRLLPPRTPNEAPAPGSRSPGSGP